MEDEKKKPDKPQKPRRRLKLLTLGFLLGVAFVAVSAWGVSWSSSTDFCMSCHEMRVVAEQGWMHSKHFENKSGVVAQCADCHIPPELFPKLWVKTRDGGQGPVGPPLRRVGPGEDGLGRAGEECAGEHQRLRVPALPREPHAARHAGEGPHRPQGE